MTAPEDPPGSAGHDASHDADSVVGRVARSGVWLVLAHICSAGATLVASVVVARQLGKADFGRYSFAAFILLVVPTVFGLGLAPSVSRLLPQHLGAGREGTGFALYRLAVRFHLRIAPVAALVAAAVAWQSEQQALAAVAVACGTAVLLYGLDVEALLTALREFKAMSMFTFGSSVGQVLLIVVGALLHVSWPVFVVLQATGMAAAFIPLWLKARPHIRRVAPAELSPQDRHDFVAYARQQAVRMLLTTVLWGRPEILLLDWNRGPAEVGLYNAALRLAGVAAMLPVVSTRSLIPEFAFLRGRGDDEGMRRTYPRVCLLLAAVTAPLAIGGAAIAPRLIVLFGDDFAAAGTATAILLVGSLVNALQGPASAAVLTGPRPRFGLEVGIAAAVLNLGLAALLIPRYGIVAAASVNVAAQALAVLAGIFYAQFRLRLLYPFARVGAVCAEALVAGVVAIAVTRAVAGPFGVALAIAAAAVTYGALLVGTRTLSLSELRALTKAPPATTDTPPGSLNQTVP